MKGRAIGMASSAISIMSGCVMWIGYNAKEISDRRKNLHPAKENAGKFLKEQEK